MVQAPQPPTIRRRPRQAQAVRRNRARAGDSQRSRGEKIPPVEVSWQAVPGFDNIDDHIDPWGNPIYGLRIFPDYKDPTATTLRNGVDVIVKTSPAFVGKSVKVKSFDIDDSTDELFDHSVPNDTSTAVVIDTEGKAGNDNFADYLNTPQAGQFLESGSWGDDTAEAIVDTNGEAKFTLKVGMQPGNNYKVVVTEVDGYAFPTAQVTDPVADTYLGPESSQTSRAPSSAMLTVWRKLWVENDSMKAPGLHSDGYLKNDLTFDVSSPTVKNTAIGNGQTIVEFNPTISDQSSLKILEKGTLILPPDGFYEPIGSFSNYGTPWDGVTISGEHPEIHVSQSFRLYDDDDFGLNHAPLPRTDLIDEVIENVYKAAFVEVVDASNFNGEDFNKDKYVEFFPNHPAVVHPMNPLAPRLVWEDAKNLSDTRERWVAHLIAGYQNEFGRDHDPSTEEFDEGLTPAATRRYSIVYVEAVRDAADSSFRNPLANNSSLNDEIDKNIKLTAAHEIGHMPGSDSAIHHTEGHLMGDGGYGNEGQYFAPTTLLRFRKTSKWQQP